VFAEWLMARPGSGIVSQQITSKSLRTTASQPSNWKLLWPSVNRY
jgi:hypothetical protein